ncbi:tetratricopeptide repeat protein [Shewanella sp. SR43-4]|jgi:tetratricopeptide (TPR) repeat protein|uniref:Tetratricopeptide repeat protein n=1 Tax=Shewanella vesiculosa TaxID=518738 RepID=A0ABV0FRR2_9GAMM|nr:MULTISPECIES: tetratricopeptide repeat protein [Shewanella]NCQ44030.1 tetratricopeptide repeat protein [Shewanella frigidimarina]MBB1316701.1 tetratricopeptide repeat protein [Shewanella sp. SR43-4]MBB1320476.1 tetratricopeptide repeat protein [Shewanella sp. SR43-8]MBB1391972.1 tetratricopeptide repeat protein [Shewanella sp. SG44-6]MBB1474565.1 tetratricopeptide repeat protein [Shewanella sp. SG41-3]|tara:strand:+ start:1059 stop:2306 length:1248 start_codon:yes stop_codon:yes gene_type:complete
MRKVTSIATALLLSVCGSALLSNSVVAAEKCEIDKRQSRAVGESAAKKVQKSFEAYTEGNLDQAISILLEANAKNDFDKAYVDRMLGNFYAEKGQMKTAIKYLKTAVDADILGGTDHAATMRLYADLLLQEKMFKEAIPYYYKWMDFTCKADSQMYRRIGIAYTELKDWNKVLQVSDKGLSLAESPDKGLYQMKLTAYFNQKKYKEAVKVLETMVPLFQDDKRLWVQLAQFYLMTEDYDKSLATYDLAYKNGFLETDSNITRLSQLLAQKGSPYKAATIFEKHLKSGLIVENEKSLSTLAGFYHNAKELKEAAFYYGKAAAVSNKGDLYLKQGRILALDQKFDDAIPVFKKALDAGIDNPGEAQFELALAYLSLKKYKSAYNRAVLAANDKKTERSAKSYISYIKEKARIHNVAL